MEIKLGKDGKKPGVLATEWWTAGGAMYAIRELAPHPNIPDSVKITAIIVIGFAAAAYGGFRTWVKSRPPAA